MDKLLEDLKKVDPWTAENIKKVLDSHDSLERRLREAEAENKRILELHKGLMAEADRRLQAAERRVEREGWSLDSMPELTENENGTVMVRPQDGPPTTFTSMAAYITFLHYRLAQRGGIVWCEVHGPYKGKNCPICFAARKESDDKG